MPKTTVAFPVSTTERKLLVDALHVHFAILEEMDPHQKTAIAAMNKVEGTEVGMTWTQYNKLITETIARLKSHTQAAIQNTG